MALIYLGPLLTQLGPNPPSTPVPHESAHSGHHQGASALEGSPSDPLAHLVHGECGYCVLLSKLPALSPKGTLIPAGRYARTGYTAARPASHPRTAPQFPNAPVRAPPDLVFPELISV